MLCKKKENDLEDTTTKSSNTRWTQNIIPCFACGALLATNAFLILPESLNMFVAHFSSLGDDQDDHDEHDHRGLEEDGHEDHVDYDTDVAWRFGTCLLAGVLLPILTGFLFPHHHEDTLCEACMEEKAKQIIKNQEETKQLLDENQGLKEKTKELAPHASNSSIISDPCDYVDNCHIHHCHDHHSHEENHTEHSQSKIPTIDELTPIEDHHDHDHHGGEHNHGHQHHDSHDDVDENEKQPIMDELETADESCEISGCDHGERHCEENHCHDEEQPNEKEAAPQQVLAKFDEQHLTKVNYPLAASILVGDFFHNFTDGVLVGTAFMFCNRDLAIAISLATVYHELAQEVADFFLLTEHCHIRPAMALLLNFLFGLSVMIGAVLILSVDISQNATGCILAIGGGVYIYIAVGECLPRAKQAQKTARDKVISVISFIAGAIPIGLVLLNHGHCEVENAH